MAWAERRHPSHQQFCKRQIFNFLHCQMQALWARELMQLIGRPAIELGRPQGKAPANSIDGWDSEKTTD